MPPEQIDEAFGEAAEQQHLEVFPENWQAVTVFLAVSSQWRLNPAGRLLGIDYVSLEAAMRMMQIEDAPDTFRKVRIMESAALKEILSHDH